MAGGRCGVLRVGSKVMGSLNPYYKVVEFIPTIGKQWGFTPQHIWQLTGLMLRGLSNLVRGS